MAIAWGESRSVVCYAVRLITLLLCARVRDAFIVTQVSNASVLKSGGVRLGKTLSLLLETVASCAVGFTDCSHVHIGLAICALSATITMKAVAAVYLIVAVYCVEKCTILRFHVHVRGVMNLRVFVYVRSTVHE
jgi:hypothetical protein